tara:strand:- start:249 stop:590 length:342 start_codon:yes stop_codon:yes gene_type:complete
MDKNGNTITYYRIYKNEKIRCSKCGIINISPVTCNWFTCYYTYCNNSLSKKIIYISKKDKNIIKPEIKKNTNQSKIQNNKIVKKSQLKLKNVQFLDLELLADIALFKPETILV